MAARGTQKLTVTVDPAGTEVTFTSGNDEVATVSSTGVVTGVGDGNTIITVTAGDKSVQVPVAVQVSI